MPCRLAIIGGSQGYHVMECGSETIGPVDTPFGQSAPVHKMQVSPSPQPSPARGEGARLSSIEVLFLSRHGETGYHVSAPFVNYRANIWALKQLGVERIIAWSGPGAIDASIPIGDILVPADVIDETKGRDYTFFEGLGIGFVRQNPMFCPELAKSLVEVITSGQGHCRTQDIYVCTQGPRLETAAEIRKFASYGGTLVGMTFVPEAFLARELEMCYCPVCYVTNYAEGVVERPHKPGELFEGMLSAEEKARVDAAVESLPGLVIEALARAGTDRACNCGRSMERYRKRGDIGEDWHTWVGRSKG